MSVKLRKRTLDSGRTQLYLDIYRFGQRKTESLQMFLDGDKFHNRETLSMAEIIRAKRELDLQAELHGISGTHNRLSSFIKYMEALGKKRMSEKSRELWQSAVLSLTDFAGELVLFRDVTRAFVDNYKEYLLKGSLMASSANIYLGKLQCTLNQAVRDNIIPNNPAAGISIKVQQGNPTYLTLEEIKLMAGVKCRKANSRNAFLFGCFTGLRMSDIRKLEWKNVVDGYIEFTQKKTGTAERMPLSPQAKLILEGQREVTGGEGLVFQLPHGNSLNQWLRTWAKRAGVKKRLTFHKSRHTFATLSLTSGIDLYTTSKLLGHRDLKSTQIYAKVIDEKKRQAVQMLPTL